MAMRQFKDNKSHSNNWQGFNLYDFEQFFTFRDDVNVPVFENLSAYRNREHGIYTNNMISAEFRGGLVSDNQWGLALLRSDRIIVSDFVVRGSTEVFRDHTKTREKLCRYSSWTHVGIEMMSTRWRYGENDPGDGLRLKNVEISDFGKHVFCVT